MDLRLSSPIRRLLAAAILASATLTAHAATYEVTTTAQFNSLPTTLHAGDIVIVRNGTYSALNRTFNSTITEDELAQTNPVIIHAETPGGVIVSGPSRISLRGRGIVLAGFDFVSGSGGATGWIVNLDANSRHMRLNNVRFLNCSAPGTDDNWLNIQGFNHTIEYCSFLGKRSSNAVVTAKRNNSEPGADVPRGHVIRYCYFGPREGSPSANGYETIRIGDSSSQIFDMRVTIEHCVFYRAIWRADGQKPNDMEIISNKSKGNIYRHNTFLESTGQLTLRHGDACLVEGNYIFGGGHYSDDGARILLRPANPYQTGIRIIGQDHVIRNNYLINLRSVNLRAALCLMAGAQNWNDGNGTSGDNGYETADRAEIYHNTFIDCGEINLGFVNGGERQPAGVKIFNNVWQSTVPGLGVVRHAAFTPAGSGGNYFYSPGNLGWTGLGGTYTASASARVTEIAGDIFIPAFNSPLLDAADPTLTAGTDMRGLLRPITGRDIGAFEREVGGSGSRPLLRHEVGPEFDGGPLGRYPVAGGISIAAAPALAQQPASQIATSGGSAFFTASATGAPRPTFQWFKDGEEITDNPTAFTATLSLPHVTYASIGHYSVRATNAAGQVTSDWHALSIAAPTSTGLVVDEQFADGNRAGQQQPASLAWYCSGAASKLTVANGAMVLNTDGTAGRHALAYFALPSPTFGIGDRLTLTFEFSLGGTLLDQNNGLRIGLFDSNGGGNPVLLTSDANTTTVNYTGYAVTANLAASPEASPAELRRRNPVANTLITSLSSYSAVGSGGPGLVFSTDTVYTGGLEIERIASGQTVITASFAGGILEGDYVLSTTDPTPLTNLDTVAFAIGSSSGAAAAATLTVDNVRIAYQPSSVQSVPIIAAQPVSVQSPAGATVSFTVTPSGPADSFSYQWRKDGTALAGATQPTFTLSGVHPTDTGRYAVLVSNSGGSTLSDVATLTVEEAGSAFHTFASLHGLDAASGAPDADPDGDGLRNLMEFILGGDPTVADTARVPQLQFDDAAAEWVFTFQVRTNLGNVTWLVESSHDLSSWQAVSHGLDGVTVTSQPADGAMDDIAVRLPATTPQLFIRLRGALGAL